MLNHSAPSLPNRLRLHSQPRFCSLQNLFSLSISVCFLRWKLASEEDRSDDSVKFKLNRPDCRVISSFFLERVKRLCMSTTPLNWAISSLPTIFPILFVFISFSSYWIRLVMIDILICLHCLIILWLRTLCLKPDFVSYSLLWMKLQFPFISFFIFNLTA